MCLYIDELKTRRTKKRKVKEFWVYKWLKPHWRLYDKWMAPIRMTSYPKKGEVRSGRKSSELTKSEKFHYSIDKGIHVYLTKQNALKFAFENCTLFRLKANLDDLVAVGEGGDAVFTKVLFDPKERV